MTTTWPDVAPESRSVASRWSRRDAASRAANPPSVSTGTTMTAQATDARVT